jgi:hypothetical protein
MRHLAFWLLCGSAALAACNGVVVGPPGAPDPRDPTAPPPPRGGTGGSGGSGPVTPPPTPVTGMPAPITCADGLEKPGYRVLRRLTGEEIETTVRVVFGLDKMQFSGFALPPDPASLEGFTNNVDRLSVGSDYARGSAEGARKVATLVSSDPLLTRLLPCATAGGPPCAETFVTTFGARLYRRPLTPGERSRYLALYEKVARQADFKTFVYWATLTLIQSPNVIYRSELGEPDGSGRFRLSQYEIASALSYTFTGGPPSLELMQAAASNRLSTPDQIETAARGLVFDESRQVRPAFRDVMLRFSDQWLGLSTLQNLKKDDVAFPDFQEAVQEALSEETRRFISGVVLDGRGTPADLLTAPYTFVNNQLATYYRFAPVAGTDFAKVMRPAGWGLGLLAQGALLSIEAHSLTTSPTKRGYLVRTRLLCGHVPPPPAVVDPLPEPTEAETTRQRYEVLHVSDPTCRACHQQMDSIGFGFEHLDATGRYREREGRFDIDDSGTILGTSAGDLTFRGPSELAQQLARLPETAQCMATYLASFAFGVPQQSASCLVGGAAAELRGGMSLVDFYVRMARSEHFRTRVP